MRSPLAARLRRHAATIVDPAMRATLFRSLIGAVADDELREALDALTAAPRRVGARVALLSLLVALTASPERQRAVFDGTRSVEDSAEERRVPDYGRGRP